VESSGMDWSDLNGVEWRGPQRSGVG